ncbi:MAG TPA: hypothetical protein VEQ59_12055, partial [Polyangiaceae bacterium]|nr:hypothetical protein [Polyangiaceae bacterium]
MNVKAPRTAIGASLALVFFALACDKQPPPGAKDEGEGQTRTEAPRAGSPILPRELAPAAPPGSVAAPLSPSPSSATPAAPEAPYAGPWFAVTSPAAGVYSDMSFERGKKLGFLRSGGRTPVEPQKVEKKNCTAGWYKVRSGGYVCGNYGTTNLSNPDVKFSVAQPNLKDILPYPYARNAKNGTPLYKTVPSREQMERYEPYLKEDKEKAKEKEAAAKAPSAVAPTATATLDPAVPITAQSAPTALLPAPVTQDPEPDKPWWQQEDIKDRLHEMKLDAL